MPATSARIRPWSRDASRPGAVDETRSFDPSCLTVTVLTRGRDSDPFGPLTSIDFAEIVAVTPFGSSIGTLPTRDVLAPPSAALIVELGSSITTPHRAARRRSSAGGPAGH